MTEVNSTSPLEFSSGEPAHTAAYLWPVITSVCRRVGARRILDVGCGNGTLCGALALEGFDVVGCDSSESGIALARHAHPGIEFELLSVYDDPITLGRDRFDAVISTEVVEHLYAPRALPRFASQVVREGGHLILSTPYHGYLKNLALSVANRWDSHLSPFWDGGHIKFWSRSTLAQLVTEEGFTVSEFIGTGRIPYFWKSMILTSRKSSAV